MQLATVEEMATILAVMPERYRLTVQIALWCTLRIGEVLELRRSDTSPVADRTAHSIGAIRVMSRLKQSSIDPLRGDVIPGYAVHAR